MDLSFLRRAQRVFARSSAAPLDYPVLIATLEALQSASPAARIARSTGEIDSRATRSDPMVELLLGTSVWREAVGTQGGCFSRSQVKLLARRT